MSQTYKKADLAKIHIAKKQLNMDDETYRAMLQNVAGVRSSKDLNAQGRTAVLNHLRTCGVKFKRSKAKPYPGKPHNMTEQMTKIEALLSDMGLSWNYANSMAKRMFKVERVAWLKKGDQLQAIIAGLTNEQTKRSLSDSIDESLSKLDMTEAEITKFIDKPSKIWRRNIKYLKAINNHLNFLLSEQ
ncbi:MAG: regulatory protein GemA [Oceanospirillaceae bacterium]|nr:regulatory protein GemA [Oceanospirillaceae bacterium]